MENKIYLAKWIILFNNGEFDKKESPSEDIKNQIKAGWYDWFCKDSSLAAKTKKMGNIIKKINGKGKVNIDDWYVWFKNNCPLNGPLYDDFRFADIETGNVMFTIQIDCCWNKSKYAVYGRTPDGEGHWKEPLFEADSSKELVDWLNEPWEEENDEDSERIFLRNSDGHKFVLFGSISPVVKLYSEQDNSGKSDIVITLEQLKNEFTEFIIKEAKRDAH